MHRVNFIDILKSYVWHVSVQVYHPQGAKIPGSNPADNVKLLFKSYAVCSRPVIEFDYVQKVKLVQV
jgi:hypothetical protein